MTFQWAFLRLLFGFFFFVATAFAAEENETSITILHTNDLHSHFRPEKTRAGLGGFARLKTAIDRLRAKDPTALLLDGGDWSEGSVYYTLEAGPEALKMMDRLGYDVSVLGNHDWLNGPDSVLEVFRKVEPKMAVVSANLSTENYEAEDEFQKRIPRFVIKQVGSVRVAIIGLSTYEWIYDRFLAPIKILEPLGVAHQLSSWLKRQHLADVVVALSHNSVLANKAILKYAPNIDLIVGAHDHVKLAEPIEISHWPWKRGSGWIVEAGSLGRYLGNVTLKYSPENGVKLENYELIPIDKTIPEDESINSAIGLLEYQIEQHYGPIFHDEVGHCHRELYKKGIENPIGDLVTDAFVEATGADLALESYRFLYEELHPGPISSADVFSVNPAIYNPKTDKTWTLKTVQMPGSTIRWMLGLAFGSSNLSRYGLFSGSRISFVFDPWFREDEDNPFSLTRFFKAIGGLFYGSSVSGVQNIRVRGKPLEDEKTYRVALGDGVIEGLNFINSYSRSLGRDLLPYRDLEDTGIENWRVLLQHLRNLKKITLKTLKGKRIRTLQPDLGVVYEDIAWMPISSSENGMMAEVQVKIRNYGVQTSKSGPSVHLLYNENSSNSAVDPNYREIGASYDIRSLKTDEVQTFSWKITLPEVQGYYPLTVSIEGATSEANQTNNQVTVWFGDGEERTLDLSKKYIN